MPKVKVLVCDDETLARQKILRFLKDRKEQFDSHEASNGQLALKMIPEISPDLVFLDMEMPGLSGVDVLHQLKSITFEIIFQTAYDHFALMAFEKGACDYLLKPFSQERFNQAVDRVIVSLDRKARIIDLESSAINQPKHLKKVITKCGQRAKIFDEKEILAFLSEDHLTRVLGAYAEGICDLSLSTLEERLDGEKFIRCHRKAIVRVDAIGSIYKGSPASVRLKNGVEIPLSRRNQAKVIAAIDKCSLLHLPS